MQTMYLTDIFIVFNSWIQKIIIDLNVQMFDIDV